MNGSIFKEELRSGWRETLVWGLGLMSLMMFVSAILQDSKILEQYRTILSAMPQGVLAAFGISSIDVLTTPEGFLAFSGFTYGALILAVYGVLNGLNITANDEDDGSLNVLLSMPIARWRIIVEKYLASALMLFVIVLLMFGGIGLGATVFNIPLKLDVMLLGALNLMPLSLSVMAITSLIASLISRKSVVSSLAAAVVVGSYFLNVIAGSLDKESAPVVGLIQQLSVFHYVDSESVVLGGALNAFNIGLLLVVSVIAMFISVYAFERRDIGG
jgi:ABC-2 type transport system permease protein